MNKEEYLKLKETNAMTNDMLYEMYKEHLALPLVNTRDEFIKFLSMYQQIGGKIVLEKVYKHFDKKFEI